MNKLLERMMKSGSIKQAAILEDSAFFNAKDTIPTDLPILNIAFTGKLSGGLIPGLTVIAGVSKSFKTLLGLYCLKAYMDKYKDAVCLFYDSEFGVTPEYLKTNGIDTSRVLHIPIEHVEQLKFDIVKRLEEIKRGDKVFIFIDSVGNLASKKEVEDALEGKSVADMSRAKSIKSLFRIITPHLTTKDIPCVAINHVYAEMGLFPKNVMSGGTGIMYSANIVFFITKAQEKTGTEISGYKFTINIEKSRFVREKAKLPFIVTFKEGIDKWSGLLDIAIEANMVIRPSMGWYQKVNPETGEVLEGKYREKDTHTETFWSTYLNSPKFHEYVESRYMLGGLGDHEETIVDETYDYEATSDDE
jgi:RecA/RadA recombinase